MVNKKSLIFILIIFLKFQSWCKADDISDFQIEGIGIGESLLNHFSKTELDNQERYLYPSKKYYLLLLPMSLITKKSKYDYVQVSLKTKDKLYKPYAISGVINFKNNINECYPLKNKIVYELGKLFQNAKKDDIGSFSMNSDLSGESKANTVNFLFDNKDLISVQCIDWSNKKPDWWDQLKVTIVTNEYNEFTLSEVYE